MSLELVREVSRENPDLLSTNIGRTCYRHTTLLLEKLRAHGHEAYLMCKSPGEGQYTPPGFAERNVTGLDGRSYRCSGVSHDAIWCDAKQFDTIGAANENDRPIYRRDGDPNWSFDPADGPQIVASPVWNEIAQHHWRANNPPLKDGAPAPQPPAPQPPAPQPPAIKIPTYAELGADAFFITNIGIPLQADMALKGQALNADSSVWFSRTTYDLMVAMIKAGGPVDPAPIVKKYRNEWRAILGLPPLP